MIRRARLLALFVAAGLAACGGAKSGSPACGLALTFAPAVILQRLSDRPASALREVPRGLPDRLPARVANFNQTGDVLVAYEGNTLVLGYQGPQFPADTIYSFGALVVDDTSQRVMGVLIYPSPTLTVPRETPRIGLVSIGNTMLRLHGVRVNWAEVSNPRCPLLGDTTARAQ